MRIEQLTFTRFLAAISIVVFHYGVNVTPFNDESVSFLVRSANLGVSYFFMLSGFVMIIAYNGKTSIRKSEYYKNRYARIYPAYLLSILLALLYYSVMNWDMDYYGLGLNILGIQSWVPGKALSINYPGWSLSVEFLFYAIFPFLFNHIYNNAKNTRRIIVPVILIWIASQVLLRWFVASEYYEGIYDNIPTKSFEFIYYFPLMHLNQFLVGNLAGILLVKKLQEKRRNYDWAILLVIAAIYFTLKYWDYNFQNGLFAIFFIPLILLISLNTGIITRLFRMRPLVFLGEISFGIYILQYPVNALSNYVFDHYGVSGDNLRFYIYLPVLIIISGLSYVLIESPVRNRVKKMLSSKSRALAGEVKPL